MNDAKNIILAWVSAGSPFVMAFGSESGLTLISAIVLPIVLFAIGKSIDVCLQIYLRRRFPNGTRREE